MGFGYLLVNPAGFVSDAMLDNARECPRYSAVHPTGWIRNGQHIGRADEVSSEFVSSELTGPQKRR